jgi:hypothetical protein
MFIENLTLEVDDSAILETGGISLISSCLTFIKGWRSPEVLDVSKPLPARPLWTD